MPLSDKFTTKTDETKRFQFGWHWGQPQEVYYWLLDIQEDKILFSCDEEELTQKVRGRLCELTDFMNELIE